MLSRNKLVAVIGGAVAAATVAAAAPAYADDPVATATYDVQGSTFIGNQVKSTLPLGPSQIKVSLSDSGQISNGTLPLPSKQLTFPVFGGLAKLTATVSLIQSGKITGQLGADEAGNGTAKANAKYTIKLTNASVKVGILPSLPLFVGNHCQTASPININVKNPAGTNFDASTGGTLTGKYTIGQFTGCNILFVPVLGSVVVNSLVPGSNNTISLTLSNGDVVFNP